MQAFTIDDEEIPDDNLPPVAKASASPAELTGAGNVTLSAAGSYDPDKDALTYQWQQVEGPTVILKNPGAMNATVHLPTVSQTTRYRFKVTVTDTHGAKDHQETSVTQKAQATGGAPAWSSTKTYANPCVKVSYQNKEWLNGWWTQGTAPGSGDVWGVWRQAGASSMHDICK